MHVFVFTASVSAGSAVACGPKSKAGEPEIPCKVSEAVGDSRRFRTHEDWWWTQSHPIPSYPLIPSIHLTKSTTVLRQGQQFGA